MRMLRKAKQFYQNNSKLVKVLCFVGLLLVVNQAFADGDTTATDLSTLNEKIKLSTTGLKNLLSDSGKKLVILFEFAACTLAYMITRKPSVFLGLPIILIFTAIALGMV